MGTYRMMLVAGLMCISLVGCSTGWPQGRLATYLGPMSSSPAETKMAKYGDVRAGLVVVNDTSAHDSAPQLSAESFDAIKEHIQFQLTKEVPMVLVGLDTPIPSTLPTELASLLQMAKDQQVDYVVLAVVSSTEIEVPDRLPLQGSFSGGGMRGLLVGYRAENLALAELALVDVQTGQTLIHADGQAWASLERLDVPLESNIYPVVRRGLEIPPIYPTREDRAHDVMRAVASSEAINQAVMHFKESWG